LTALLYGCLPLARIAIAIEMTIEANIQFVFEDPSIFVNHKKTYLMVALLLYIPIRSYYDCNFSLFREWGVIGEVLHP
jgi:hypothetical protein